MKHARLYSNRWYNGILEAFFRIAATGWAPPHRFRPPLPDRNNRPAAVGYPSLEIVSHCWRYAHMLIYQLSSMVLHPPTTSEVVVTVFHTEEDAETMRLLDFIGSHEVPRVRWNWQPLPGEQLFRRSIGRNRAALNTRADWIWMTDCDVVFHAGCLDSLAERLRGRNDVLLYPRQEYRTALLADTSALLTRARSMLRQDGPLSLLEINPAEFSPHPLHRAKGEYQIIHGDVARAIGYCDRIPPLQTPAPHWCKCREDRVFRWLAGTQGIPIDVDHVYQIRHAHKGRYRSRPAWSGIRSRIRRLQSHIKR